MLGGVAYTSKRGIIIPKNDKKRFVKILFHELAHHICEGGRGYMGPNYDGLFINEAFTEFLGYEFLKEYKGSDTKIRGGYPYQVIATGKLIDLAAKRLNKPVEDVYNYMMRGYLIKGFKGLNLFYEAFGRDFLGYEGISMINEGDTTYIETEYKGLLSIGPKPTDIKGFVNLIKIYCWDLGFDTLQEALEYFDYHNKPSSKISNIMGIERTNKKYISKKSKILKNKKNTENIPW